MSEIVFSSKLHAAATALGSKCDAVFFSAFARGDMVTTGSTPRPSALSRATKLLLPKCPPKRPAKTVEQLASARRQKRRTAAPSELPMDIAEHYTQGEQSVLVVIAQWVMKHGFCDLCIDAIGCLAGVGRTTVQNALRKASKDDKKHLSVEHRPRRGRKNETNIVRVVASEWVLHLKRRIGFKKKSTSPIQGERISLSEIEAPLQGAYERKNVASPAQGARPANVVIEDDCRLDPLSDLKASTATGRGGGLELSALAGDRRGEVRSIIPLIA
jgi:hypothetical protein